MQISKNAIDDLNAVVKVKVEKVDFEDKVQMTLKNYKKQANIPGFRKGMVPMSFIKKQYEKAVVFDEVNKVLQKSLNKYLIDEKISILGNPLPKQTEVEWGADEINFEFELGIEPKFELDLSLLDLLKYKVIVSEEEIDKYIENFANKYGSTKSVENVTEKAVVKVKIENESLENSPEIYLSVSELVDGDLFMGKKVTDKLASQLNKVFKTKEDADKYLGVDTVAFFESDQQFSFELIEITETVPSDINQGLFDKIYGEGTVKDEKEFRVKIAEESEKMYSQETDRDFFNEALNQLLDKTIFDLPKDFLVKWLEHTNEDIKSPEQAAKEFVDMEKGLRYQLIQSKLAAKFEITVEEEDLKQTAIKFIKEQFGAYGNMMSDESFLDDMVKRVLTNQEERSRIANRAFDEKLLVEFNKELDYKTEDIGFDDFIKIVTEKQKQQS